MSQQATAGRGAGREGGEKPRYFPQRGAKSAIKAYKSLISRIEEHMFNMGHTQNSAQFTQSCKNVANFLQCTAMDKGYQWRKQFTAENNKQSSCPLP